MNSETGISSTSQSGLGTAPEAEVRAGAIARPASFLGQFFGVYLDPRTWGALLFVLLSLVTGILYFTWAVAGASLSLGFLMLIIGFPFVWLFLLSVRGLTFLEARLVEALLGVKTRRQQVAAGGQGFFGQLKALVTDRHTWVSLLYLILQLPLGVIYFTIVAVALIFSLSLIALPVAFWSADQQSIMIGTRVYTMRLWIPLVMALGGFLMFTGSLHVVRGIGRSHGRYARALLDK